VLRHAARGARVGSRLCLVRVYHRVAAAEQAKEAAHVAALLRHAVRALLPARCAAAADAPPLGGLCDGVALEKLAPGVVAAAAALRAACDSERSGGGGGVAASPGDEGGAGAPAAVLSAFFEGPSYSLLADALLCGARSRAHLAAARVLPPPRVRAPAP
jgi:hypothetical protein